MRPRRFALIAVAALVFLITGAAPSLAAAPSSPRTVQQFTTGWRFFQGDAPGADQPAFNDTAWKPVTLPHDWAITGPVTEDAPTRGAGGFFPSGIGWYRKTFTLPAADTAPNTTHRVFIAFDG